MISLEYSSVQVIGELLFHPIFKAQTYNSWCEDTSILSAIANQNNFQNLHAN